MSHKHDITSTSPGPEVDLVSLTFRSGHGTFSFGGEASLSPTLALSPSFLSKVSLSPVPSDTSERGSMSMNSRSRHDLKSYEDIGSHSTFEEGLASLTHRSRHESRSVASTESLNDWGDLNAEIESGTGMVAEKARRDQVDDSIVPTEGEPSNVLGYVSSRTIPSPQWSLALQDQTFRQNLGDQAKPISQRNSTMTLPLVLSAITSGGSQQPCTACPAVEKGLLASVNKVLLKYVESYRKDHLSETFEDDAKRTWKIIKKQTAKLRLIRSIPYSYSRWYNRAGFFMDLPLAFYRHIGHRVHSPEDIQILSEYLDKARHPIPVGEVTREVRAFRHRVEKWRGKGGSVDVSRRE